LKLLTRPEVRPDALLAALGFVADFEGGDVDTARVAKWMQAEADYVEALREVAVEFGFLVDGSWKLSPGGVPDSDEAFAAAVHEAMLTTQQWDVIDAYASVVVACDQGSEWWLHANSSAKLAEDIGDQLRRRDPAGAKGTFNSTRWPAWSAWVSVMGLGLPMPQGLTPFTPYPVRRLSYWLQKRSGWEQGKEIPAAEFLAKLANDHPYLDGGTRWEVACFRAGVRPKDELSWALSGALRALEEAGIITLTLEGGDRPDVRRLAVVGGVLRAFASVRIGSEKVR
jgi:hypothetical protein